MPRAYRYLDPVLTLLVLALVLLGVSMVYSSAGMHATDRFGNEFAYLSKQLQFAGLGTIAMFFVAAIPYQIYRRLTYPILIVISLLLIAVLIPGVGVTMGGATRWLDFGVAYLQPSEIAKFALLIYLAYSLERKQDLIDTFTFGIAPHLVVVGFVLGLILLERDFGTTAFLTMILFTMMFLAGARVRYLAGLAAVGVPLGYLVMMAEEYRRARLTAFLDPFGLEEQGGFQVVQSWLALHHGGWIGTGLGAGARKLSSLPAGFTDFIYAVIGEELGFVGCTLTLGAFLALTILGALRSWKAPDLFGRLLGAGVALSIGLQALINMMVVTGLLPTKGITLPLISYGGSSILFTLAGLGILLNVTAQARMHAEQQTGEGRRRNAPLTGQLVGAR